MRKRLWDPVHRAAGSANELFLVPEGAIWNVSWLALPGRGNGYLADEGRIVRVLNAERELLGDDAPAGRGLLAMGGPDFDLDRTAASRSAKPPTAAADRSWPCVSGRAGPLGPLPAARAEAEAIAGIWDTSTSVGARALFVGAASDERARSSWRLPARRSSTWRRTASCCVTPARSRGPTCAASAGSLQWSADPAGRPTAAPRKEAPSPGSGTACGSPWPAPTGRPVRWPTRTKGC
ncbi:MAG: CHAT domain-containing protein [bacterium]|nr:CHAT domain-containing protein [bacterium]